MLPVQVTGLQVASLAKEPQAYHSLAIALSTMTDQTITFPAISNKVTTDTVGLAATASSGLPVTFTTNGGPASISGTNLTFSGAGTVSIVASQAGNGSYNAAPSVTNLIHVYALSANSGAYAGGNSLTITNGNIGTITNVLVGGVRATITASGANWFTITLPATGSAGAKAIVIQTSDNGDITLAGAYTVNPAGMIGVPSSQFAWTNLSSGLSSALRSIASINGDLYALGYFTEAGGVPANDIAKWNGSSWTNLGAGINLIPYDLAAMAIGPNGDLYAGGIFTTAGGIAATNIAKWDGSTWTNLSTGIAGSVYALAIGANGDLYAGGGFISAGGTAANRIAKWDGSTWTNLGTGMNGTVLSLSVAPNGDLYVGGSFSTAGGTAANRIAKWDGSTWTNLGTGMNNSVAALSVAPNGDLYAGGHFATAGGTAANRIAKWDGSTWTNLGTGINGVINGLAFGSTGDLYAGGDFTTAGGTAANRIAKWDGNTWTNLSTGVDAIVYGLAQAPNGGVYAGGNFTTAGGLTVSGVAQWGSSLTGVAPSSGICTGGYPVTITGTNLGSGLDITNVTLCGVSAASITSQSSTQVVVVAGVGTGGLGDVRVFSTSYGQTVKSNAFTYLKNDQTISGFLPTNGSDFVQTDTVGLSATASSGLAVTFTTNGGPATINGTNLTFTSTGTVSIVASQAGNGTYNAAPNVTNTFTVTAASSSPVITAQPVSAVVTTGSVVSLSVTNSGTAPFGYQWLKDGAILTNQTSSTLSLASFKFTDSGSYQVVITNAQGMTISLPANLSVPNAPLRVWGKNGNGQLGNGTTMDTNRPITVASNVVSAAGGQDHSLFVKADGTLWAMGRNQYGQLGDGTITSRINPVQVASDVVVASCGYWYSLFVKADGTLWAMGRNQFGQLGNGTTTDTNRPVQVASNVVAVAGVYEHSLFLKADGTLWAMGRNQFGQLGNGSYDNTNRPVQVASNVMVAAGVGADSLFLKTDGTLWGVGDNTSGQLGNGTTTSTNWPIHMADNVVAVAGGGAQSLFVKADRTLWAVGLNNYGQLGDGTTTNTNRPIHMADNVVAAAGGQFHSLFVKADGTLWAMGRNNSGQLGDRMTSDSSVPVLVQGSLVASLAQETTADHSLAIAGVLPMASVANRTVTFGQATNFTAFVTEGDGPFTYQWQFGGTNIVNATNDSYTIASAVMGDAGSYNVIVAGTYGITTSSVATLTVDKANQTVTFPNIGNQLTTNVVSLSATASSSLLVTNFSVVSGPAVISGISVSFTNSGVVTLSAIQNGSTNYNASAATNISFSVTKATASVSLSNTNQTYDGTAKSVTVTTVPTNLTVAVTYNSSATVPNNAAGYTVVATVNEIMYQGGTTGTLTIAKANQTISFPNIGNQEANNKVGLAATATSALTVSFAVSSGPAVISNGTNLSFSSLGSVSVLANQSGDSNWNGAPVVTNTFDVIGVITNVTPSSGTMFGGTQVTISGLWLGNGTDITNVTLCGIPATIVTQSVHSVVVTAGISPVETNADVVVQSAGFGAVTLVNGFSYLPIPPPPTALSAIDITADRFTARWTSSEGATNYLIDVSETNTFTSYTGMYGNWNAGNVTACLVTGLTDGVTYYYRVRAANQYGSSLDSNIIEVPVSTNTPYIKQQITNGVASAGSGDILNLNDLFHGVGKSYQIINNSNPGLVSAVIDAAAGTLSLAYKSGGSGTATLTVREWTEPGYQGFYVDTEITVYVTDDLPTWSAGSVVMNLANGLFEQTVSVTNISAYPAQSVTLTVSNITAGAKLYNATGTDPNGHSEIHWVGTLGAGLGMDFTLQYYTAQMGITPTGTVSVSLSLEQPDVELDEANEITLSGQMKSGSDFVIGFNAVVGKTYYIQYASTVSGPWETAYPPITALTKQVQWVDSGPPVTEPAGSVRFYRVIQAD
jgi:alpha-tubulin suppressor-like RCC1 family protein